MLFRIVLITGLLLIQGCTTTLFRYPATNDVKKKVSLVSAYPDELHVNQFAQTRLGVRRRVVDFEWNIDRRVEEGLQKAFSAQTSIELIPLGLDDAILLPNKSSKSELSELTPFFQRAEAMGVDALFIFRPGRYQMGAGNYTVNYYGSGLIYSGRMNRIRGYSAINIDVYDVVSHKYEGTLSLTQTKLDNQIEDDMSVAEKKAVYTQIEEEHTTYYGIQNAEIKKRLGEECASYIRFDALSDHNLVLLKSAVEVSIDRATQQIAEIYAGKNPRHMAKGESLYKLSCYPSLLPK